MPLVSGPNGLLPVGSQISTYGQQIINTVMIKQVQDLDPGSEKKQSAGLMSIKQLEPESVTIDDEPQKPTLQSGNGVTRSKNTLSISILNSDGLSFDLAKEYEKQNQRIEESKLLDTGVHPEPQVQSQIELLQSQKSLVVSPVPPSDLKNEVQKRKMQWVAPRMLVINTNHCRSELDTV